MSDELIISVIPQAGSKLHPLDVPITITDWKSADDMMKSVIVRSSFKRGNNLLPGNALMLSPGEAYMMYRALSEYLKVNHSGEPDAMLTGVVCHAKYPSK